MADGQHLRMLPLSSGCSEVLIAQQSCAHQTASREASDVLPVTGMLLTIGLVIWSLADKWQLAAGNSWPPSSS
ncbi:MULTISPECIES: hypothetical protein [Paracoccus]|uniref:hypothetical protein n=1 Tax=Paracoccus TaxID=265 RepID=UPI0011024271|nr:MULTISPECIES: hypothetical protein [Paracoccus]MCV2449499.1 hypothetical protein [Paracoccus sp. DMF]